MEENLQYYFDIADKLLQDMEPNNNTTAANDTCPKCKSVDLVLCYADGCHVCTNCGEVVTQQVFAAAWSFVQKFSNYKRIHHFHERISQFSLNESIIPEDDMQRIVAQIKENHTQTINKTNIRKVLRHLGMQNYIEKWLQIMWRVTTLQPPILTCRVSMQLDLLFIQMQLPFLSVRPKVRKNFLNYNYVFNRLFQKLGLSELGMFFPLIKSKSKLAALDNMWYDICDMLGWQKEPLITFKPFSIKHLS